MNTGLIIFGILALVGGALVFVSKKWGKSSALLDVSENTTKTVLKVQEGSARAKEDTDTLSDSELDDELRKLGVLKPDS